jgi:hypothetical protein
MADSKLRIKKSNSIYYFLSSIYYLPFSIYYLLSSTLSSQVSGLHLRIVGQFRRRAGEPHLAGFQHLGPVGHT